MNAGVLIAEFHVPPPWARWREIELKKMLKTTSRNLHWVPRIAYASVVEHELGLKCLESSGFHNLGEGFATEFHQAAIVVVLTQHVILKM